LDAMPTPHKVMNTNRSPGNQLDSETKQRFQLGRAIAGAGVEKREERGKESALRSKAAAAQAAMCGHMYMRQAYRVTL
jgi:hypothetical protein